MKKTKQEKLEVEQKSILIDDWMADFPDVPTQYRPRKIILESVTTGNLCTLQNRGYEVVNLRTLPRGRGNEKEEINWLLTLLQGVSDGTVNMSKSRNDAINLEMKARGMLGTRPLNYDEAVKKKSKTLDDIMNWSDSRHQLQGVTTTVEPEKMLKLMQGIAKENTRQKKIRKKK